MIYPDVRAIEWAQKYGLEEQDYFCPRCEESFKTLIPIVTKECAGLASTVHSCGPGYVGYVLTPRRCDVDVFWRQILY